MVETLKVDEVDPREEQIKQQLRARMTCLGWTPSKAIFGLTAGELADMLVRALLSYQESSGRLPPLSDGDLRQLATCVKRDAEVRAAFNETLDAVEAVVFRFVEHKTMR